MNDDLDNTGKIYTECLIYRTISSK